jgi:integrase
VSRRKDGLWVARISLGYGPDGKRRRLVVYGKTKGEALEKLRKKQGEADLGTLPEPDKQKLSDYLARWLDAARPSLRLTTYTNYEWVIRGHIAPHLGAVLVAKLTPAHVQGLLSAMGKAEAGARTRQLAYAVLHRALEQAVKWNLAPRNVADAVEPPRVPKKAMKTYTAEQAAQLLQAAQGNRLEALFVLAVSTGLRQGELFGLAWPDLDLDAGTVFVQRQLQEVKGKLTLTEPKSDCGRRRVELPAFAVAALHEHRKWMLAEGHLDGPVFCDTRGGWLRKSNFTRNVFKPLLQKAGLPPVRFHDLRHTAATLRLLLGDHPKVVKELLGHSQINLTMDTYSHVLPTLQKESAARLDGLLGNGGKKAEGA